MDKSINVFGRKLEPCCSDPITGFYRDGFCNTSLEDRGNHAVCVKVTEAFLKTSKAQGNDLITPIPEYGFPGLKEGDKWCLCSNRYADAVSVGIEVDVDLEATNMTALRFTDEFDLRWKYRPLYCPLDLYESQLKELLLDEKLYKELKILPLPKDSIGSFQLIGLDGGVKRTSKKVFSLKELEEVINSMPMRQDELREKDN